MSTVPPVQPDRMNIGYVLNLPDTGLVNIDGYEFAEL